MFKNYFIPISGPNLISRLFQLNLGLVIFGFGIGLMLLSNCGVPPWDVFHDGLAKNFGGSIGLWSIVISFAVMLLWLPLKEPFGLGTVANGLIIGLMIDLTAKHLPLAPSLTVGITYVFLGILLASIGSGMYINSAFGPGPRDGLMTGLAKRGPSIRLTRFSLEGIVLILGCLLGGAVGWGTLAFAVLIGPGVQYCLKLFAAKQKI